MTELLEGALAFVGIVMVLALAAERLQELVKAAFALKSNVRVAGVRRLVHEAATAAGFKPGPATGLVEHVLDRLRALNQRGLRNKAVRLDHVTKCDLKKLIAELDPDAVEALRSIATDVAKQRLHQVAVNVEAWYDLAMAPVDGRHARRMRLGAFVSAAVVVLAVNADGLTLIRQAWSDSAFQNSVNTRLGSVLQTDSVLRARLAVRDSLRADTTAADAARAAADSTLQVALATRNLQVDSVLTQAHLIPLQYPAGFHVTARWIFGILLSTLLVSLGAPFWHDVLESVLGLKKRATGAGATNGTSST